jgi:hypothetical protein
VNRATSILTHGWLGNAVNVFTFGYFGTLGAAPAIVGKVCLSAITMTIPGATLALFLPGATVAMTAPSAAIEFEDCT